MPLRKNNTRSTIRMLYAGMLETVTLLKRDNDLREGTVRAITLFDCLRMAITKSGEPIQGELPVLSTTVWLIPSSELARNGVPYINVLDRLVDQWNRFWQPESGQSISNNLYENIVRIVCVRIDPPSPPAVPATTGVDYQEEIN